MFGQKAEGNFFRKEVFSKSFFWFFFLESRRFTFTKDPKNVESNRYFSENIIPAKQVFDRQVLVTLTRVLILCWWSPEITCLSSAHTQLWSCVVLIQQRENDNRYFPVCSTSLYNPVLQSRKAAQMLQWGFLSWGNGIRTTLWEWETV